MAIKYESLKKKINNLPNDNEVEYDKKTILSIEECIEIDGC